MLLIFTALYVKLNNTSSSLPVSGLGAESLHQFTSHPNLQPQKEDSAEGSQQNFISTVQTCIILFLQQQQTINKVSPIRIILAMLLFRLFPSKFDSQGHLQNLIVSAGLNSLGPNLLSIFRTISFPHSRYSISSFSKSASYVSGFSRESLH